MSQWLCKGLRDRGYTVVLMETRRIKAALKAVPVKTDRRDALGIAHLLRMGWFQPVHCKSDRSQAIRVLLGARRSLVQSITRLELSMRGLLRNFGLRLGAPGRGREGGLRRLCADADIGSSLPLPRLFRAVQPLLRTRAQMRTELHGAGGSDRSPGQHCDSIASSDPIGQTLRTLPGVGPVVALTYVTAGNDPTRFRYCRDVGACRDIFGGSHAPSQSIG